MVLCSYWAIKQGYLVEVYHWNKPSGVGKSHQGGARQATSTEHIVVVYKCFDTSSKSLSNHYALLKRRDALVRAHFCVSVMLPFLLLAASYRCWKVVFP